MDRGCYHWPVESSFSFYKTPFKIKGNRIFPAKRGRLVVSSTLEELEQDRHSQIDACNNIYNYKSGSYSTVATYERLHYKSDISRSTYLHCLQPLREISSPPLQISILEIAGFWGCRDHVRERYAGICTVFGSLLTTSSRFNEDITQCDQDAKRVKRRQNPMVGGNVSLLDWFTTCSYVPHRDDLWISCYRSNNLITYCQLGFSHFCTWLN